MELLKKDHIVYAIDISKKSRSILRKKCAQYAHRIPLLNADARHLTEFKDEMFDGITSMFVVYYIDDYEYTSNKRRDRTYLPRFHSHFNFYSTP